jgi:hydroxymethylbilane synthase
MSSPLRIGTRKSALAKTQSSWVLSHLQAQGITGKLVEIVSEGDRDRSHPLYAMENASPGLFCKQLEEALLAGTIDLAVHSLKDLPTTQPEGLWVAGVPLRETVEDWLLIHPRQIERSEPLSLARNARVGTSSLRREAQLLNARADLRIEPLRGNVPSRVAAVRDGKLDAAVLASAGLRRLGISLEGVHCIPLDPTHFVPAPGQGALAIEARADLSNEVKAALQTFHHAETHSAVQIERQIMRDLEGGCTLPFGAWCRRNGDMWELNGFLGVAKDRLSRQHEWVRFEPFHALEKDSKKLIDKAVLYFRPFT